MEGATESSTATDGLVGSGIPPTASALQDIENTVGFGLIQDALKLNQITVEEAAFLEGKYKKLHRQIEIARQQDGYLTRRLSVLETDILAEKIALEKARIDEVNETQRVQRAGELRNNLQKEVEDVEQKDTMAKFELFELRRVHEELQKSLVSMKKQNSTMVDPVLEKLRREVSTPATFNCIKISPLAIASQTSCCIDRGLERPAATHGRSL